VIDIWIVDAVLFVAIFCH